MSPIPHSPKKIKSKQKTSPSWGKKEQGRESAEAC